MYNKELNRVWSFMLKDEWIPKGEIFFSVIGGFSESEHEAICEKYKETLLKENDDDYTSWVFTGQIRQKVNGMGGQPYVTVIGFRLRDTY